MECVASFERIPFGEVDRWSPARAPDIAITGDLRTTPPTLGLVRGGRTVHVPIGALPYPDTDVATVWGVSDDGKHVAVSIRGPDVPGLLSNGQGGAFQFFFVAPAP